MSRRPRHLSQQVHFASVAPNRCRAQIDRCRSLYRNRSELVLRPSALRRGSSGRASWAPRTWCRRECCRCCRWRRCLRCPPPVPTRVPEPVDDPGGRVIPGLLLRASPHTGMEVSLVGAGRSSHTGIGAAPTRPKPRTSRSPVATAGSTCGSRRRRQRVAVVDAQRSPFAYRPCYEVFPWRLGEPTAHGHDASGALRRPRCC